MIRAARNYLQHHSLGQDRIGKAAHETVLIEPHAALAVVSERETHARALQRLVARCGCASLQMEGLEHRIFNSQLLSLSSLLSLWASLCPFDDV